MDFFEAILSYIRETFTVRLPFFPSNIRSSLFIILFCVIAITELYIYIIFRRISQFNYKRLEKKWKEKIHDTLANIIIYDDQDNIEATVAHFYPQLKIITKKNNAVNEMLVSEILIYHKNFTGKIADILKTLYKKLQLDKRSIKKIKNRNWEIKVEGIREANQMELFDIAPIIMPYTDDENASLRMEAQAAYIKLSDTNPFKFLDRAQERILDWHQLVLFEVITKNKKLEIPSFSKWLRSPNDTVVMLCLKLIDHFMQFDAETELERLLKHHNPRIRKKAIEILGKLEIEESEENIFEIYFDQPLEIKLEILKALGKISSGKYTDFLSSRIYSDEYKIKMEALKALKMNPDLGEETLRDLFNQTSAENRAIIKHVLDERIKT